MFILKARRRRDAHEPIPRAVAYADSRAVALGYLLGTGLAGAVIAQIVVKAG